MCNRFKFILFPLIPLMNRDLSFYCQGITGLKTDCSGCQTRPFITVTSVLN